LIRSRSDGWRGVKPLVEIDPQAAPLHPLPLTLHDTAVFDVPVTVAMNC